MKLMNMLFKDNEKKIMNSFVKEFICYSTYSTYDFALKQLSSIYREIFMTSKCHIGINLCVSEPKSA